MTQFTSHIDFSLTKKRLKMMGKRFSAIRSGMIWVILLPIALIVSLVFCTDSGHRYPQQIDYDNGQTYSNIHLFINPPRSTLLNIEKRGPGIRYDSLGNPFSGTHELRLRSDDKLVQARDFENGVLTRSITFDKNGDTLSVIGYGYIGDNYKVAKRIEKGVLIEEWKDEEHDGTPGYHRQWYTNGQLKYEVLFKGEVKYDGLMTLYDIEGNILKQELYENGNLVEKFK